MDSPQHAITSLVIYHGSQALDAFIDAVPEDCFDNPDCLTVIQKARALKEEGAFIDETTLDCPEACRNVVLHPDAQSAGLSHIDWLIEEIWKSRNRLKLRGISELIDKKVVNGDPDELIGRIREMVDQIDVAKIKTEDTSSMVCSTMSEIEKMMADPKGNLGFNIGFKSVNRLTLGAQRKALWLICARPGGCKSMLAGTFARHAMTRSDARVHIISLEMSRDEWVRRFISAYSRVNISQAIIQKKPDQLERLNEAAAHVAKMPLTISDRSGLSIHALERLIRARAKAGDNYFILDHLGLMRMKPRETREEMGRITGLCKQLAKELDIHISVLIQLNRKAEEQMMEDQDPSLRMLAESDRPGQDCDVCLILDLDKNIHVVKNRNGAENVQIDVETQLEHCIMAERQQKA